MLLGNYVALPRATALEDVQELLQEGQPCFVRVRLLHGCVEVKHSSDLGQAEHIHVSVILQKCKLTAAEREEYRSRLREVYWLGKKWESLRVNESRFAIARYQVLRVPMCL